MAGAADRPVFDFFGSLNLAKSLKDFAELLEDECGQRKACRDECLAEWKGEFGRNHEERAQAEDEDVVQLCEQMREASYDWRVKWRETADEMNNVLYNEAIEAQQAYVARKTAEANANKAWWEKTIDFAVDVSPVGVVADAYNWLAGGKDTAHNDVEPPSPCDLPGESCVPSGPPFVRYYRSNDSIRIHSYVDYPPSNWGLS